jgi:hypothetical protein
MVRTARDLVLALLLTVLAVGRGHGQSTVAPPGPVHFLQPVTAPTLAEAPSPGLPPPCAAYEDENGPLLYGDPRLDGTGGCANLGWIGSIEADVIKPVVHARLFSTVLLGSTVQNRIPSAGTDVGTVETVALPFAPQQWTVMPRIELGYRFGQGAGELLLAYRNLTSTGSETVAGFDAAGAGTLQSHVRANLIDLDYAHHEGALGPMWDMKWRAGVRILNVFTETQATGALMSQRITEAFTGAGPHVTLDVRRKLPVQGLSLFGRIDNSYPIGPLTQLYQDTVAGAGGGAGSTRLRSPSPLTSLGLQAGLNYYLNERLSVTGGYTWERFWDLTTFYGAQSRAVSINLQGFFLRAEWKY